MNWNTLKRFLSIVQGYWLNLLTRFLTILGAPWLILELINYFYTDSWGRAIAAWRGGLGLWLLFIVALVIAYLTTPIQSLDLNEATPSIAAATEECGNRAIDLSRQRLTVSNAFGSYFAGLLEADNIHTLLPEQIDCRVPNAPTELNTLEQIMWSFTLPYGQRLLVIGADAGMGKSTLAAKLTRCLYERGNVQLILGDSAKNQIVDLTTGVVSSQEAAIYNAETCIKKICAQVGVPYPSGRNARRRALAAIVDKLVDRKAIIIVDNLETVEKMEELLHDLEMLLSPNVRAIVTSRKLAAAAHQPAQQLSIQLQRIQEEATLVKFLRWHIRQYSPVHPELAKLEDGLTKPRNLRLLLDKSHGVPLLIQLLTSEVVRNSWEHLASVPNRLSDDLLDYFYKERWEELGTLDKPGVAARRILVYVAQQQQAGKRVTLERLQVQLQEAQLNTHLSQALQLLYQRFLIVNQEINHGNFVIFPTLRQFIERTMAGSNGLPT